jgi:hypothetical protein
MTTWDELAQVTQALLCRAAELRRASRDLVREVGEGVGRALETCRHSARLVERSRRLRLDRAEGA